MRVVPRYRRCEMAGFRNAPESGVVCAVCCYDIGPEEDVRFWRGQVCHARCLREKRRCDHEEKRRIETD